MDQRIREAVFPVAIYEASESVEGAEVLLQPCDLQIGLAETHIFTVHGKGYIVLDFGKEIHGAIRILTVGADGGSAKIRIRTGESVAETYAELGEKNAHNHHTLRDIHTDILMFSDMEFLQTGFRFVRIDFEEDKAVALKTVLATYIHRDLKPAGTFVCDDERVNRIFDTAAHTLMLNMQNYIWDGIKRDRLVWIGDMHPETTGISCLFGEDSTVEPSLDFIKAQTPLPAWMNGIPSYTAWWLIILHDYYLQNGNKAYLEKNKDYIEGVVKLLEENVTEEGKIAVEALFDWPSHESPDEKIGVYAIWSLAAQYSVLLFKELGLDTAVCYRLQEKLQRGKDLRVEKYKQCEAMLVYAGLKKAQDAYEFLTDGGAKGFSTFMSYYLLSAIAQTDPARAVELMKEFYGAMLDLGATSFWEDFNLDWVKGSSPIDRLPKAGEKDIHGDFGDYCYIGFRHSLCHGWSCGPVPFLMRVIGGIRILEPGCKKMEIKPVTAGFKSYHITYPTPFGLIEIDMKDGKITKKVPKGIKVVAYGHS